LFNIKSIPFILLLGIFTICHGQDFQQVLQATRISSPPKIDGKLTDEAWGNKPIATVFIQKEPNLGLMSSQRTKVKLVYDDDAIYVGAHMQDVSADSVLRELGKRDQFGHTDIFGVMFDTFDDDINGFGFFVTAAGVQRDVKYSTGNTDILWNAVWNSEVSISEDGWYAEIKIPYSALRFPDKSDQTWGLNFYRKIRRTRESSYWNKIDPTVSGFINQFGILTELKDIKAPPRLSFTPYVSSYINHYPYDISGQSNYAQSINGGMDLKYGLNESFTLDMMLIPDFGQVKSDNEVLNLSPFEVYYRENRSFFTEGTELFKKGGIFYSRRIGGIPEGYYSVSSKLEDGETVINNPRDATLYNATKVSGRTANGLGIGFLNSISKNTYATILKSDGTERKILTEPLTNYNLIVFDKSLKNSSFISIINTNTTRHSGSRNANVTATDFEFYNKANSLSFEGNTAVSQVYEMVDSTSKKLNKVGGNTKYGISQYIESNTYDPNDMGFIRSNNEVNYNVYVDHDKYTKFWKFLNLYTSIGANYSQLYNPYVFTNFSLWGKANTTMTNYLSLGTWGGFKPIKSYDYYEPRISGRYFMQPAGYNIGFWFSSDYRKRLALDGDIDLGLFINSDRKRIGFGLKPRFRINNHASMIYGFRYIIKPNNEGFAAIDTSGSIIFGKRDVNTFTQTISLQYIFTNKLFLDVRLRYYWSTVKYNSYHILEDDGYLSPSDYSEERNTSFNAFNVDWILSWEFSPGSSANLVWKNAILDQQDALISNYYENFRGLVNSSQSNTLSIKILYYLDYLYLKK